MEKLTKHLKECLASLSSLTEVRKNLKEEDESLLPDFENLLSEHISELCDEGLAKKAVEALVKMEEPKESIVSDPDLFVACQDEAAELFENNWGEESAKLAVAAYLSRGGELNLLETEAEKFVTLGTLYSLESDNPFFELESKLTAKQQKKLPANIFCGPGRTFPVNNKVESILAFKLLESYTGSGDKEKIKNSILEKSTKFGVGLKEDKVSHFPILIETTDKKNKPLSFIPFSITDLEEAKEFSENIDTLCETYGISEKDSLRTFISEIIENSDSLFNINESSPLLKNENSFCSPLELGNEFLLKYFTSHEYKDNQRENLSKLVGLVRTKKIKEEEIETNSKPYKLFGVKILEKLLNSPIKEEDEEVGSESNKVEPIDSPVNETRPVQTSETSDGAVWVTDMAGSRRKQRGTGDKQQ